MYKDDTSCKGKVLILHGWAQNSVVMRNRTKKLNRKLTQMGYECIFPESPLLLPRERAGDCGIERKFSRENARAWFFYSDTDPSDTSGSQTEQEMEYFGLKESLLIIRNTLQSIGTDRDFCAVLGFSQGGVFAHVVASLAAKAQLNSDCKKSPFSKIRCVVLCSSFAAMNSNAFEDGFSSSRIRESGLINLPSLHVIGKRDTRVMPHLSEKLAAKFDKSQVYYHVKGHIIPQSGAVCSEIIEFIDKQRVAYLRSSLVDRS